MLIQLNTQSFELFQVLLLSCKVMAPFTPFFTEVLYQNMRKVCKGSDESIHYCSFPTEEGKVYILIYLIFSLNPVINTIN